MVVEHGVILILLGDQPFATQKFFYSSWLQKKFNWTLNLINTHLLAKSLCRLDKTFVHYKQVFIPFAGGGFMN